MSYLKKAPKSITFVTSMILLATSSVVVIDSYQESLKIDSKRKREVSSSLAARSCLERLDKLFPSAQLRWSKAIEEYGLGEGFDYDTYTSFKNLYEEMGSELELVEKTPESLLAYLEGLSLRSKLPSNLSTAHINPIKRRKLVRLIDSIDPRDEDSLKDFTLEVYQSLLGPEYRLADVLGADERLKDVAYRIIQQDLSAYGLKIMSSKYKLFAGDETLVSKISSSPRIKKLLEKIVYLPTIMGYMPPTKTFKIPKKYLEQMLHGGMDERLFSKIMDDLNEQGILDFQSTIRYEVFRRYYNVGITLIWSYISLEALIERDASLKEERNILVETADEVSDKINTLHKIRKDATLELSNIETFESTSRECKRFNRCLKYASRELGREVNSRDSEYSYCKENRDPDNNCE